MNTAFRYGPSSIEILLARPASKETCSQNSPQHRNNNPTHRPRMDLHESPETNIVTATFEFPGVPKEDVHIDVKNAKLTVSAEIKQTIEGDEKEYAIKERRFGKISRTLQLPEGIQGEEIKATMDHGLLKVTFPRAAPEEAPKRIYIV